MDVLTSTTQSYIDTFGSYINQFLAWGQWLFYSLLIINMLWLWLWYAVDKTSIVQGISSFLKKFFVILFFYTLMMNPEWLANILQTSLFMGKNLTGKPIDPSSIIANGIAIANKIIVPVIQSSILSMGFGTLVVGACYLAILYVFINVALEVAVTVIVTTALIVISTFFLGFSSLGATSQIARKTINIILANCIKLLGLYLVIGVGANTITTIANAIPQKMLALDPYCWIIAASFLFLCVAKNLPQQLARIVVSDAQENRGTDVAAAAMAAVRYASIAMPVAKATEVAARATGITGIAKLAGSAAYSASAHFGNTGSITKTVGLAGKDVGKAAAQTVSESFSHLASKMTGGKGKAASLAEIPGVAERVHTSAKAVKAQRSENISKPSTANTRAGQPKRTNSQPKKP